MTKKPQQILAVIGILLMLVGFVWPMYLLGAALSAILYLFFDWDPERPKREHHKGLWIDTPPVPQLWPCPYCGHQNTVDNRTRHDWVHIKCTACAKVFATVHEPEWVRTGKDHDNPSEHDERG